MSVVKVEKWRLHSSAPDDIIVFLDDGYSVLIPTVKGRADGFSPVYRLPGMEQLEGQEADRFWEDYDNWLEAIAIDKRKKKYARLIVWLEAQQPAPTLTAKDSKVRCPYCHAGFVGGEVTTTCIQCNAKQHTDCWEIIGCATCGER